MGLILLTVVEGESLVRFSKRLQKPTIKVGGEDLFNLTVGKASMASSSKHQKAGTDTESEDDEEPSMIYQTLYYVILNFPNEISVLICSHHHRKGEERAE